MNLYKLIVLHGGPKSSCKATLRYITSSSVEEVYDTLDEEAYWCDKQESWEEEKSSDPEGDYGPSPKERIMKDCGDLEDDDWSDAYYGIWKYGWEDLGPITEEEIAALKKFKILT